MREEKMHEEASVGVQEASLITETTHKIENFLVK
jgi:hypothetical protein